MEHCFSFVHSKKWKPLPWKIPIVPPNGVQFTNEYSEMCMHHKYKHGLSIHTANNQMGKRERNSSDLEIVDFFFCHRSHFYGFFFSFLSNSSFRTINTNYLQHKHNVSISHIHTSSVSKQACKYTPTLTTPKWRRHLRLSAKRRFCSFIATHFGTCIFVCLDVVGSTDVDLTNKVKYRISSTARNGLTSAEMQMPITNFF